MTFSLRSELMNELNMLKSVLKEAENEGEVSHNEREKIMNSIGQIKCILYSNGVFKSLYTSAEVRNDRMLVKQS